MFENGIADLNYLRNFESSNLEVGESKICSGVSKSKLLMEKQENIHPVNCEHSTLDVSEKFVSAQHRHNTLMLLTNPNYLEQTKKVETGGKLQPKSNTTAEMT